MNAVLRMHSIKPHWMFALDNLVRSAVQAAITVLSPELGANLAGGGESNRIKVNPSIFLNFIFNFIFFVILKGMDRVDGDNKKTQRDCWPEESGGLEGAEEGSTSGVSTVNSKESSAALAAAAAVADERSQWLDELRNTVESLRMDNIRLMQELVDMQRVYHDTLRQTLSDHQLQLQWFVEKRRNLRENPFRNPEAVAPLVSWLESNGLDEEEIQLFVKEDYILDDVLDFFERRDLERLGLSGGCELRLWRAILKHRKHPHHPEV